MTPGETYQSWTGERPIEGPIADWFAHVAEHGCGTGDVNDPRYCRGTRHCPEAVALMNLVPSDEQPVVLAC